MYDNQSIAANIEQPRQVMAQAICNEFNEQNKWQTEFINTIESKLHSILNLRQPEKDSVGNKEPTPIQDFAKEMEQNLFLLRTNNARLDKIINHLNQIV